MLKIGDFSKLSRISIRMLRHYDEIGLLKPFKVDEANGYRYYEEAQLLQAGRISGLKNMGFTLSVIGEIMEQYADSKALTRFLSIKRREMEEQQEQIRQKLCLLDNTIKWLRKDGTIMGYDVTLKTIPERYVASVKQIIPSYKCEGMLWKILLEETAHLPMQEETPCYAMAVFHDGEFKEKDVEVEVQKTVLGKYKDTEHVRFKTDPAVQVASAVFKGSYEQFGQINQAVAEWIHENGYEFDGCAFNIYHVSPGETKNPEEYVTEVCYPVKNSKK